MIDLDALLTRLGIRYERKGGKLWARCPSPEHEDRNPSWCIDDQAGGRGHGRHRCWSCGFGGYPTQLVEAVLGLTRAESKKWIASDATAPIPLGVSIDFQDGRRRVFRLPPGVKLVPLSDWPTPARRYAEERGLTPGQVKRWSIGYAADGRLRGRLVFPVFDSTGRLLSYTARSFSGADRKYLEPRKAEGANLGAVFGEQYWPGPGGARSEVVVVEGALDALAVERATGGFVAGLFGSQTKLHPGHVSRVSSFARVVVATDPDSAGSAVANELAGALARWCETRRVELPTGEDCGSLPTPELRRLLHSSHEPADGHRAPVPV